MLKELEIVRLAKDLPASGLEKGARGTVVHRYRSGKAFEVEFLDSEGETIAVETLTPAEIAPLKAKAAALTKVRGRTFLPKRNVRIVYKRGDGKWVNVRSGATKPASVHSTQSEAEAAAREMLRNSGGGSLTLKGRDGHFRTNYSVHGRNSDS